MLNWISTTTGSLPPLVVSQLLTMNYHLSTYPRGYHPQLDHTTVISQALGSFIESKSATFACGGSVAIEVLIHYQAVIIVLSLLGQSQC